MLQSGGSLKNIGPVLRNPIVYQRGYGFINHKIYRHQKGRGIGSVFSGLFRYFQPLITKGLKSIAREALNAGTDIVKNSENQPLTALIKSRSEEAYKNLKRKADEKLEPLMKGSGFKRRKKNRKQKLSQALVATRKPKARKQSKRRKRRKTKKTPEFFD